MNLAVLWIKIYITEVLIQDKNVKVSNYSKIHKIRIVSLLVPY